MSISFPVIAPPDEHTWTAADHRVATLPVPPGGLGRIGDAAAWLTACLGACPPPELDNLRLVLFASDHAAAAAGASAHDPSASRLLADRITSHSAVVTAAAARAGATVELIDVGLHAAEAPAPTWIRDGAGDIRRGEAMTASEAERAVQVGIDTANNLVDSGVQVIAVDSIGIGGTTPAAAIVGALTSTEAALLAAPVRGLGNRELYTRAVNVWKSKTEIVRDAMYQVRNVLDEPIAVAQMIGSPDIAATMGLLAQAAVRRTPVIIDGPVSAAAAMLAAILAPGADDWWLAATVTTEPAHALALEKLGLTPLLDAGLAMGGGTGAMLALDLLRTGVEALNL